ncbi:MAG: DUF192 domain-containing protein [Actinomycetota bacterium]
MKRLASVALVVLCVCAQATGARGTATVSVGGSVFHVRVADNEALRDRGLMGVRELAPDEGMLFTWRDTAARAFYMKDTLIPLDLISIAGGRVVGVATMVPCTADPCPITSTPPASAALEVPAGTAKSAGIAAGALVQSSALR